jgi:hypothetical protein
VKPVPRNALREYLKSQSARTLKARREGRREFTIRIMSNKAASARLAAKRAWKLKQGQTRQKFLAIARLWETSAAMVKVLRDYEK